MTQQAKKRIIIFSFLLLVLTPSLYILYSAWKVVNQESNQGAAYRSLERIRDAQLDFNKKNGRYGSLIDLTKADLIPPEILRPSNHGYRFEVKTGNNGYVATGTPVRVGRFATGFVSYFLDESGKIRGDRKSGVKATIEDPVLPEP